MPSARTGSISRIIQELFGPEHDWERYGCEDPRATTFEGKHYIFYTAVREFSAEGIKVAVAITEDCKTIKEKHIVTPFNAKAMALFPERVNGKIAVDPYGEHRPAAGEDLPCASSTVLKTFGRKNIGSPGMPIGKAT